MKHIQTKIILWSGLCLLFTVLVIVVFSSLSVRNAALEAAEDQAVAAGEAIVGSIENVMEEANNVARTFSQLLSVVKDENADFDLDRDQVNMLLKKILDENPNFKGIYTAWEPNAFDDLDSGHKDLEGHDETGRYIPYLFRDDAGEIKLEALLDYDKEGVGDYYQLPKKTKKEVVLDPYLYPIAGRNVLLTSFVAPIVENGTFYGIAGVDLSLEFMQGLADKLDIYDHSGRLILISNNGTLSGLTGQPELVGKNADQVISEFKEVLPEIKDGRKVIRLIGDELQIFIPIHIGKTTTPWSVGVSIPKEKITSSATRLVWRQLLTGAGCFVMALVFLWFISGGISKPIRAIADGARCLSQGDTKLEGVDNKLIKKIEARDDELGDTGRAFEQLIDYFTNKSLEAGKIAEGDLTGKIVIASERDELGKSFLMMTRKLNDALGQVNSAVSQFTAGSGQVSDSSQDLSRGASEQAASLEEITSAMTELGAQTRNNAENASMASQLSMNSRKSAEDGNTRMAKMIAAVSEINDSSKEIAKIIKTIDDIAFQTNLLALNAAVEAARAGKHGKGFAVVAQEVRNLAGRSAKAAQETAELIEGSMKKAEAGADIVDQTAQALAGIVDGITKTSDLVNEIASASGEQSQGIAEINQGLGQIEQVTQQNTANAEETASAAEQLSSQAMQLKELVARFKLLDMSGENHYTQGGPTPVRRLDSPPEKALDYSREQTGIEYSKKK